MFCNSTAQHACLIPEMFLASHGSVQAYNEGWGQLPEEVGNTAQLIRAGAPGKLVTDASGWIWHGLGDFADVHQYAFCLFPVTPKMRSSRTVGHLCS